MIPVELIEDVDPTASTDGAPDSVDGEKAATKAGFRSRLGIDAPLPLAARFEVSSDDGVVRGVGLRVGGTALLSALPYGLWFSNAYLDLHAAGAFDVELGVGGGTDLHDPHALGLVALQWDRPGPFQAQVGGGVASYWYFLERPLSGEPRWVSMPSAWVELNATVMTF